jgi:coiled-coil domain-containing protein 61
MLHNVPLWTVQEAEKKPEYDDASAEIADIDSRLHALQSFLRAAKSSR